MVYTQDTGLKKLIFVEMEEYPGFIGTPSPLPQKIETLAILKIVTSAIKITEKVLHFFYISFQILNKYNVEHVLDYLSYFILPWCRLVSLYLQ